MSLAFAVLPYVSTSKPFSMMRTTFRNSRDTEELSSDEIDHLNAITSLFYWTDQEPITEVVYTLLRLPDDRDLANSQIRQLRDAQTVLSFLIMERNHCSYEHLTLYVAVPKRVFQDLSTKLVPGYAITVDWLHSLEVTQDRRLYPPVPYGPFLPLAWDLSSLELRTPHYPGILYGLEDFVRGETLGQQEQAERFATVLRAMAWYNRSFSRRVPEEERLVRLAVAFEILFHHQGSGSDSIRTELKTHLQGLFGNAPRLDAWVDQFYNERSRIVHEGRPIQLRFVFGDKRPPEQRLLMDSLVSYGQRLLEMCIENILHASSLAERANLGAWFTHDQERLQTICKLLSDKAVSVEQRLDSITPLVFDLGETWVHVLYPDGIELKTLFAAGKMLVETYLEMTPELASPIQECIEQIVVAGSAEPLKAIDAYEALHNELGRELGTYRGRYWPRNPQATLAQFAKYASDYRFRFKAEFEPTMKK